jgi:hypothetical protein
MAKQDAQPQRERKGLNIAPPKREIIADGSISATRRILRRATGHKPETPPFGKHPVALRDLRRGSRPPAGKALERIASRKPTYTCRKRGPSFFESGIEPSIEVDIETYRELSPYKEGCSSSCQLWMGRQTRCGQSEFEHCCEVATATVQRGAYEYHHDAVTIALLSLNLAAPAPLTDQPHSRFGN